jgi:Acetyltransferases
VDIIKADIKYFDSVYSLICELENELVNKETLLQVFIKNIANSDIFYYLAIDDGEIVGFASVHLQYLLHHMGKIAELQELVVSKDKQGHGIGSFLFEKVIEMAMENECLLLEVCCNQVRGLSHKFYIKQGMKNSHYKFTLPLPCTK